MIIRFVNVQSQSIPHYLASKMSGKRSFPEVISTDLPPQPATKKPKGEENKVEDVPITTARQSAEEVWKLAPDLMWPMVSIKNVNFQPNVQMASMLSAGLRKDLDSVLWNAIVVERQLGFWPNKCRRVKTLLEDDPSLNAFQMSWRTECLDNAIPSAKVILEYLLLDRLDSGKKIHFSDEEIFGRIQFWKRMIDRFGTVKNYMAYYEIASCIPTEHLEDNFRDFKAEILYSFTHYGQQKPHHGEEDD